MRWNSCFVTAIASLATVVTADPTWPAATDEIEELMYQVSGFRARQFGGTVVPCNNKALGPGRHGPGEWIRSAFHDIATTRLVSGNRVGGLDGSLQFELYSGENEGQAFISTLDFMKDYHTRKTSIADLISLGVYYASRSCGGPAVPVRGGRIDATAGLSAGFIPIPQDQPGGFENKFARMGFSLAEAIELTACGHTLGSVHTANFPTIITANDPLLVDGAVGLDSTSTKFDNNIAVEFIAGNSTSPLIQGVTSSARRTNSDTKLFSYDGNTTISAMSQDDPTSFNSRCSRVFQKMIEVVPAGVTLSDPIQPYFIKPVNMQLNLNDGASYLQFTGYIRVRTTADPVTAVSLTYQDRNGSNACGPLGCVITLSRQGFTRGFDDTFDWYPISRQIPTASGISSFTVTITRESGQTELVDNNGIGYPLRDEVLLMQPQSCFLSSGGKSGQLTVTAAIRNDRADLPGAAFVSYMQETGVTKLPVPQLKNATITLQKGKCAGDYTVYTGTYTIPGGYGFAARVDVVSGTGFDLFKDEFNAVTELAATCNDFTYPREASCSVTQPPPPDGSLSSSVVSTTSGPSTSSSSLPSTPSIPSTTPAPSTNFITTTQTSSTAPVASPHHRSTMGGYKLVGCQTEATGGRALAAKSFVYDGMTLESCMKNCTGYNYWGTEYGNECYCANTIDATSTTANMADCNMLCSGDKSQYCGAGDRIELYLTTSVPPTPTPTATLAHKPTVPPYTRVGCYTELSAGRALSGSAAITNDDEMTNDLCASHCSEKSFAWFATQYARECYCGHVLDPGSSKVADSQCDMPCAGDAFQYCGGSSRLELYHAASIVGPSMPANVTDPASGAEWALVGCHTEAADGVRALRGKTSSGPGNSLETCAEFCSGFEYFGTEYGAECYCGDELSAGSELVDAAQCSMPCAGDALQYCGAGDRLSLYQKQ